MTESRHRSGGVLFRVLLTLAAAVLIVLFLPRERTMTYEYTIGKPWRYGQIMAAYDFPIYKSEQAIREELDSAFSRFQPYYKLDATVGKTQMAAFQKDMASQQADNIPKEYVRYLLNSLAEVYAAGILGNEEHAALLDSNLTAVRIEQGTSATPRLVKNLYTTRSAYVNILSLADSAHYSREILARCDINNYLMPNLVADVRKTRQEQQELRTSVTYASGMVQAGEKIVDRGDIVTPHVASIIESMKRESVRRHENKGGEQMQMGGKLLIVLMLLTVFAVYLALYRRDYWQNLRSMCLLYLLLTVFPIAASLLAQSNLQSVYILPVTIVAIFVSVFMDSRTAFVTDFIAIVLASLALHEPYTFALTQFISGVTAIYSLKQLTSRSQLIRTAFIATVAMELFMLGYELSQGHTLGMLDASWYISGAINGVLLLFAYPFLFVLEKVFGFTSPITLIELSNVSNPLLRKLSKEAQGTFNHSMQVANLAGEIAAKIDADQLLVRTGALYHDIGKIMNAAYFTENQSGTNPHDSLSEERSAQIIIQHVTDGLELADKYRLPKVVKDFIATHHGCSKAGYFYIKWKNAHPDEPVDESVFTYPGPNPSTKEQGILMIADSVEAASKSLKTVDEESLRSLVNNIVDGKVKDGYLSGCPLTFSDVQVAKDVLVQTLKTIYHTRISYPTINEKKEASPARHRGKSFFKNGQGYYYHGHKGKHS